MQKTTFNTDRKDRTACNELDKKQVAPNLRLWVQAAFTALCVWVGVEFYFFTKFLETGGATGSSYRPPGVEGFLPISSLMSHYFFLLTGEIHPAHPAGLFILLAILAVSLLVGKSFCSWLCPVGLLSEILGDLGDKLFRRRIKLPRWLDYPLRSMKYLILGFFVYSIFFLMTAASLRIFLDSPYNVVADIKMYYFFADISQFSLVVVSVLFFLSIPIRNFWCRYLCPYGALLGILSLLSLTKIRRNMAECTNCGECTQVCPSFISVDRCKTVRSDECTSCLKCIDSCAVTGALKLEPIKTKRTVNKKTVALVVVGVFVLITGIGMVTGNWQNSITIDEYLRHKENQYEYGHPISTTDISEMNSEADKK